MEALPDQSSRNFPTHQEIAAGLTGVSTLRLVISLASPFIWCGLYFLCAVHDIWPLAVFCLIVLSFVTYGSVSHDLVHANLKLRRRWNDMFLFAIELLALRSGHAYRAAHLHHHARFPHDDDVEGTAAGMKLWRVLLEGVVFQFKIVNWALRNTKRDRNAIVAELLCSLLIMLTSLVILPWTPVLLVYVVLMIAGGWVIPLVTSYLPHVRSGRDELHQTRRFRGKVASLVAFEHLYHLEHHLYPAVPHHHWPALARRLDPCFDAAGIPAEKFWF